MSDVEFILGGCAAVLVFWAVTALSIYRATRWSKRMHRELELHAPLLSTEHRLDAALREVEEGYNVCDVCGFENFKRFHFCNVCGEELADDELAKGVKHQAAERVRGFKKLWKSTKHGSVEILSRSSEPPRLTRSQRSRRQRRARQRKEWTRQLNADGKVVWVRDASDKAELRFPGTVVQFISPTTLAADGPDGAEDAEAIEVVVVDEPVDGVEAASGTGGPEEHQQQQRPREDRQSQSLEGNNSHSHSHSSNDGEEEEEAETPTTTASTRDPLLTRDERMRDLNAVVAAVSMELVEASLADAAVLPVVAASDAGLQEDQMFYLNPNSRHDAGENHLMYYFAAGRLVGRALLDGYNTGVESLGLDFSVTEKRGDAIDRSDLAEPLMVDNGDVHRVDVALREAAETTIACKYCGFENFHKATACSMCSEPIGGAAVDDKTRAGAASSGNTVQILSSGDDVPLSRRLKRARQRREWTRWINADGKLVWLRDGSSGADLRFPGYAVLFKDAPAGPERKTSKGSEPEAEPEATCEGAGAAAAEVTIVTHGSDDGASESSSAARPLLLTADERSQELRALAKTTRLEVTDASVADASLLPLVRCTSADVQWHDAEQTLYLNANSCHDVGERHLVSCFAAGRLIGRALLEGSNDGVETLGLDFSVSEKRGDDPTMVEGYVLGVIIGASVLTAIAIVALFVIAYTTRYSTTEALRIMDLNAPLLPNSTAHRLDAALREAREGYSECACCGFANFKRFPFCNVCGERLPAAPSDESARVAAAAHKPEKLWINRLRRKVTAPARTASPPAPSAANVQRLQRARQRKEWARRLDIEGALYWYRDASAQGSSSTKQFPGLVLVFDDGADAAPVRSEPASPETERGIPEFDEVTHALETLAASQRLALVASTEADPARLALASATTAGLSWASVFRCANAVDQTFSLNPHSREEIGSDHLRYFFAAGRL
ncbi:hypothetical protein PybrP1_004416, partial [[Pythium] brassicae (nom. inval.)]